MITDTISKMWSQNFVDQINYNICESVNRIGDTMNGVKRNRSWDQINGLWSQFDKSD